MFVMGFAIGGGMLFLHIPVNGGHGQAAAPLDLLDQLVVETYPLCI